MQFCQPVISHPQPVMHINVMILCCHFFIFLFVDSLLFILPFYCLFSLASDLLFVRLLPVALWRHAQTLLKAKYRLVLVSMFITYFATYAFSCRGPMFSNLFSPLFSRTFISQFFIRRSFSYYFRFNGFFSEFLLIVFQFYFFFRRCFHILSVSFFPNAFFLTFYFFHHFDHCSIHKLSNFSCFFPPQCSRHLSFNLF